jgi:hypothetical protein
MGHTIKNFMESARSLTKNPLGVIGLFISLLYGFSVLLIIFGGENLSSGQLWLLTIFITVFAFTILGTFFRLVTKHHRKLYAPQDFRNDRSFLENNPMSAEKKQNKEIIDAKTNQDIEENHTEYRSPVDTKNKYAHAENLGFLAVEKETGITFEKYRELNIDGLTLTIDGLKVKNKTHHLLEIKFVRNPNINIDSGSFNYARMLAEKYKDTIHNEEAVVLHIVFVTEFNLDEHNQFIKNVEKFITSSVVDIKYQYYELNKLEIKYQ